MQLKLIVIGGKQAGMEIPVPKSKFLIGRGESCHLRPQSHTISRKHCLIRVQEGAATIEDCGSTNGTLLNGKKIEQRLPVNDGDRIKVGVLELEVHISANADEKEKAEVPAVEASARTVASSAAPSDDLEISKWLSDDDGDAEPVSMPMKKSDEPSESSAVHDTIVGKPTDETTTTIPAEQSPKEQKKKIPIVGRFKQPAKPKAESSGSAAEEMLRQFFPGKKT